MDKRLLINFLTASETSIQHYRTHVYYNTIDVLLEETNNRFSKINLSLLTALEALVPKSDLFLNLSTLRPFLSHYNISEAAVEAELPVLKTFLLQSDPGTSSPETSLHKMYSLISQVPECFPTILKSYQLAMTIGVSSATAERSFSSLRRIKTYIRSTMSQTRLSNLALLYIERDLSSQLWDKLDELVIRFAETHNNSRIVLF